MLPTRYLLLAWFFACWSLDVLADDSADGAQEYADFADCRLLSGESIAPCRIGYRTFGKLNTDKTNAVLVPTWFTGTSADHDFLVSEGIINSERYFVILVDALGN